MKASERLDRLKEEKEKLASLSSDISRKNVPEKKTASLDELFKKKMAEKEKVAEKIPEEKKEKVLPEKTEPRPSEEKKEEPAQKKEEKPAAAEQPVKKTDEKKETLESIFQRKKQEKQKKEKITSYEQQKRFAGFIKKAGIDSSFHDINKKLAIATGAAVLAVTLYLLFQFITKGTFFSDAVKLLLIIWVFGSIGIFLVLWMGFFIYIDLRIYQRKQMIEAVFPDFLQLTAANISSGMPIDRALWFAIRPRFGILAKEMETVAKATMVGENLGDALTDFANKYDSVTIKRSINLLLEGMNSGGEIGDLLRRVANNIQETEIIRKEMAANVTTYVIFILFATLGAAPFLFGLTTELIVIMTSIMSGINLGDAGSAMGGFAIGGGEAISLGDYQIFAIVSICMSSFFAGILISVIQKGNAKEAFKNIPVYMIIGVIMYFIAFSAMELFLGGMF